MTPWAPLTEVLLPLFVAMSPLTVMPLFLSMTEGMASPDARSLARRAVLTAFIVAATIVWLGQAIFAFLRITLDDLRVAGGLVLLTISIYDLVFGRQRRKEQEMGNDVGIVPLGTPLIVGPASMTTCVVLADSHGRLLVFGALAINLFIMWLVLHFSDALHRFINPAVSKAVGKVMSLFLAAIAVHMLRAGILGFINDSQ
jgi:multiple antibiotic resistance protein